jgi:hypothetical protein
MGNAECGMPISESKGKGLFVYVWLLSLTEDITKGVQMIFLRC